ncbi:MAG: transposase [bacterium]
MAYLYKNLLFCWTTVYSANPELLQYCTFGFPGYILKILERYPTARKLCRARVKRLTRIPGVHEQKAKKMIAAAKTSVASMHDELIEEMIVNSAKQIQKMSQQIDKSVRSLLKNNRPAEIDLLMSIPGIGEKTALGLYMEIGPVHRFADSKKLASYAGIHPVIRESGDGRKRPKMSKRGRKVLRSILFFPAMVAVQHDEHMKKHYEKHRAKGKSKLSAYGIIMHKLLRIAFGVLKSGKPYDAAIDKENSTKKQKKNGDKPVDTRRRFQAATSEAPLSKHAMRKRRQSVSHSFEAKIFAGSKTAENENIEILQTVNTEVKNETISS